MRPGGGLRREHPQHQSSFAWPGLGRWDQSCADVESAVGRWAPAASRALDVDAWDSDGIVVGL